MAVGVQVGDVMRKAVVTTRKNSSIEEIAKIMDKAGIGSVILTEKGKTAGILTEGDIIKKVIACGKNPKKTSAASVMTKTLRTISRTTDIEDAASIMRDLNISRLPVIEKGRLVGIITERDMVKIEPALLELMVEKGNLEEIKPTQKIADISGYCENCRNYSEDLRFVDTRYLCDSCRRL